MIHNILDGVWSPCRNISENSNRKLGEINNAKKKKKANRYALGLVPSDPDSFILFFFFSEVLFVLSFNTFMQQKHLFLGKCGTTCSTQVCAGPWWKMRTKLSTKTVIDHGIVSSS